MKRIVQARHGYASAFLTTGRMLRAPRIDVPTIDLPGAVVTPYTGAAYPSSVSPAVLASLWRAPNGHAGYVFTNIIDDRVEFELAIDANETGLDAEGKYEVFAARNGEQSLILDEARLPAVLSVGINPMDVLLIEAGRQTPGDGLLECENGWGGAAVSRSIQQGESCHRTADSECGRRPSVSRAPGGPADEQEAQFSRFYILFTKPEQGTAGPTASITY